MKKETALQIINEALNIAIAKGCFGLVEVTNIVKAVEFIGEQPDIQFGEVTEDTVIDWIQQDLGVDGVSNLEACIQGQINSQINPPVVPVNTPLPWSTPVTN